MNADGRGFELENEVVVSTYTTLVFEPIRFEKSRIIILQSIQVLVTDL